jgi:hypothetical protein
MSALRPLMPLVMLCFALTLLAACEGESGADVAAAGFQWQPLFGDGTKDNSEPIATVGQVVITSRNLDLFLDGLPSHQRTKYDGPDGERLALKKMIEIAMMVQGAVDKELFNDQDVARTLIAQRRSVLDSAMRNYGLLRDVKPSEAEVRQYYLDNKDQYRQLGVVRARHIETLTKDEADKAHRRLVAGGTGNDWASVLKDVSVNKDTKLEDGEVGWFNRGGFVAHIRGSEEFSTTVYDLPVGLHAPLKIANRWHVVDVVKKEPARGMTFSEAKATAERDMMPAYQDAVIRDYLREARNTYQIEMKGRFAPGQGLTAEQLMTRARAISDTERSLELLNMIHTDYPDSPQADKALFLAATLALENWSDQRIGARYLKILLEDYPDSELADDARYLQENLYNPKVMNPTSIDDLRKQHEEGN